MEEAILKIQIKFIQTYKPRVQSDFFNFSFQFKKKFNFKPIGLKALSPIKNQQYIKTLCSFVKRSYRTGHNFQLFTYFSIIFTGKIYLKRRKSHTKALLHIRQNTTKEFGLIYFDPELMVIGWYFKAMASLPLKAHVIIRTL